MHERQILGQEFTFCVAGVVSGLAVTSAGVASAINQLRKGEGPKTRDAVVGAIGGSVAIACFVKADNLLARIESTENSQVVAE